MARKERDEERVYCFGRAETALRLRTREARQERAPALAVPAARDLLTQRLAACAPRCEAPLRIESSHRSS